MVIKSYGLTCLVLALLSACTPLESPKPLSPPPTELPKSMPPSSQLKSIQLTTNLDLNSAAIDWMLVFEAMAVTNTDGGIGLGLAERVASFSSLNALRNDTAQRIDLIREFGAPKKKLIVDTVMQRVSQQVDFRQQDFITVYMNDGGPPFGEYHEMWVGDTVEFCIVKAPNPSGISGTALRVITGFYTAPKGTKVRMCKRSPN